MELFPLTLYVDPAGTLLRATGHVSVAGSWLLPLTKLAVCCDLCGFAHMDTLISQLLLGTLLSVGPAIFGTE